MAIKIICPYCGGICEAFGGADGNPFNKNRKEEFRCTVCGRNAPVQKPTGGLRHTEEKITVLLKIE